jgi:SNF2 family DNA or RNA helicase/ubiquinone/menaquinone biosynthesis C-methylase UbiE
MSEKYKPNFEEVVTSTKSERSVDRTESSTKDSEAVINGWLSQTQLIDYLGVSYKKLLKLIEAFLKEHPGPEQHIITVNSQQIKYSPVLVAALKEAVERYKQAPRDWANTTQLTKELNRDFTTIARLAESYRTEHPEWFGEYLDKARRPATFYAPELVRLISEQLNVERPPEGWRTLTNIANSIQRDTSVINKFVRQFRLTHPEWFREFRSLGGLTEFYSPELIAIIEEEFAAQEKAPPGWMAVKPLAKKIGVSAPTIRTFVNQYRSKNPKWFKLYYGLGGMHEHYAPELIDIISSHFTEYPTKQPGWETVGKLSKRLHRSDYHIEDIAKPFRESHPQWFKKLRTNSGVYEHYAPELVEFITKSIENQKVPQGWLTNMVTAREIGVSNAKVREIANRYRANNPHWFKIYLSDRGHEDEHYAPELVDIIKYDVEKEGFKLLPSASKEGLYIDESGNKWGTVSYFYKKFNLSSGLLKANRDRIQFIRGMDSRKATGYLYSESDVLSFLADNLDNNYVNNKSDVIEVERFPERYLDAEGIYWAPIESFKANNSEIPDIAARFTKLPFIIFKDGSGKRKKYYAEELAKKRIDNIVRHRELPKVNVDQKYIDDEQRVWVTDEYFIRKYQLKRHALDRYTKNLKSIKGRRWSGQITDLYLQADLEPYARELVDLSLLPQLDESGMYIDHAGIRWVSRSYLREKFFIKHDKLVSVLAGKPSLMGRSRSGMSIKIYREDQAIEAIKAAGYSEQHSRNERREEQRKLEAQLKEFMEAVELGRSMEAQEFRKLITLFGSSKAIDILFRFRPEFQGVPVENIKSVIANYIGDFLVIKHHFNSEDLEAGVKYLGEPEFREGLTEVIKNSCLEFYHQKKKDKVSQSDTEIIKEFIENIRAKAGDTVSPDLESVLQEVEDYYLNIIDLPKPSRLVEFINEGRPFPDLNQLINVKEVMEKKKMLIADDMGLGKSASAILAKEYLGVKRALIVAPSNVIDTWQNYLESYFQEGQRPPVLVVDTPKALHQDYSPYEYVLISQERLNEKYLQKLQQSDFGMLIIDEVHKLKNLQAGKRSQHILELAESIQKEDKYLVTLSGTPAPNKVEDIAMILKLLYPEKFEHMTNRELVQSVIEGDVVDLRSLLVPRMQMKSLRESVEMPQHKEWPPIEIELSDIERHIYEVLLEQDSLTATQKIRTLRQFLLNPELMETNPVFTGSKIEAVNQSLLEDFRTKQKIVMFVNGYIENVIRGPKSIVKKLNLPEDVEIRVIEGKVKKPQRLAIQKELNQNDKKILLVVSGQTADVGVDFSGGESVYFYNEPWTKYDLLQQLARVYRFGLKHDMESKIFITKNTIEEGIHRYIEIKQRSIEKILKGIPLTDLEKELLEQSEKQQDPNLEVNPELAEYYFTSWDRLMRIFSEVKQIGEKDFQDYLAEYGQDYAECYLDLGTRSYQANGSRLVGTLIDELAKSEGQDPERLRILDIASGPEMLKRHVKEKYQKRIFSIDINKYHFAHEGINRAVASFNHIPFENGTFDYINLSFALHYTKLRPSSEDYERVQVLSEINRILKEKGKGVINLIYSLDLKSEADFKKAINVLGFKIVEDYSGEVTVGQTYKSRIITLEKERDIEADFQELLKKLDKQSLEGLKFIRTKFSPKDTKRIVKEFSLADKSLEVQFNQEDKIVLEEEEKITNTGNYLKQTYGGIKNIPGEVLRDYQLVRFFDGYQYVLFKKLKNAKGVVIVKD